MIRFTNTRPVSRMKNVETGQEVNVKKGRRPGRSTDHYFYVNKGVRVFLEDADVSKFWVRIQG